MTIDNLGNLPPEDINNNSISDIQYVKKLLEMPQIYALEKSSSINMKETHTPFEGTPKTHPNDDNILILLTSPFAKNKKFYEFPIKSVGKIEDMGIVTSENGQTAYKIKVWIKKGMPGLIAESFIVE